ncbi:MAG: hypothetical protein WCL26_05075 [Actinomycetes bacterium]
MRTRIFCSVFFCAISRMEQIFLISTSTVKPTPTPSPSASPTPSPTPTPTVKPTPTPTPKPSTSATAQPVLPQYVYGFEFKSFVLTKTSLKALQAITAPAKVTVTVNGYADAKKSGGEDDVRLSLDRALTIKTALLKLHPTWTIKAYGLGHKVNAKCSMLTNRCAEIIIKKG